ncbi:GAF domain-containing protein, partial [Myxosarcina sp. GI1]|uniref:GAF domain-containing protein n=1 Tax=Myxosarcina sp. GI1 TaxID=1541065 RepID=UPI0012E05AA6
METQKLSETQIFFRLVMDNIPQSIFWKDRNSNYLGCNRNFARNAGLETPEAIVGKNDYDLPWTKEESDWYRECDRRVIDSDTPEYHIVETQLRADGKLTWLDTNKIPLHDDEGNVIGILGTYEDISDRQEIEASLEIQLQKAKLFNQITQAIRKSLDTQKIFQTTVTKVRRLLQADRVAILRFDLDADYSEGEFVAESVLPEFKSALKEKIRDRCFGERCVINYHKGKVYTFADVKAENLTDCYYEILSHFQIKANLVIPLLEGNKLWGLLCIHQCSCPRQWQAEEIQFVQKIATQLGIAIYQAQLLERERLQRSLLTKQNKLLAKQNQQLQAEIKVRQQAKNSLAIKLKEAKLLNEITLAIRNSLNTQKVFQTAVT